MSDRNCQFPGCDRVYYGKGLCQPHYLQRRRGSDLTPLRPRGPRRVMPKFATLREKIEHGLIKAPSGHWIWPHAKTKGYGVVRWNGTLLYVHRAYLIELGVEVPDEMEIDHLCRITECSNPMHLDVVTGEVNKSRIPDYLRAQKIKALNEGRAQQRNAS